jgi:hypothetical protein
MIFDTSYQVAVDCVGGEKPGTRALQDFMLEQLDALPGCRSVDSGIYNCRNIRGSRTLKSVHSEGRAGDLGVRTPDGMWPRSELPEPGIRLWCDRLIDNAEKLGVTYIIYAKKSRRPGGGWSNYRGLSPHYDHIHYEISREAANALTPKYVREVLTPEEETAMTLTEYIEMQYWQVGKREADKAGFFYWLDQFSKELRTKAAYSRAELEGTETNRHFIYGLENP